MYKRAIIVYSHNTVFMIESNGYLYHKTLGGVPIKWVRRNLEIYCKSPFENTGIILAIRGNIGLNLMYREQFAQLDKYASIR